MPRVIPNVRVLLSSLGALTMLCTGGVAHAHFKLLAPTSWLNEDQVGGPQKGSPCGPGNTGPLGDDVSPVPESGKVTEVHAGDTVMVDLQETIYHPGYFRIALAEKRSDLKIPPVDDPNSCALDLSKVPTGAHDNVLMDGLWKEEAMTGSNRHLMQAVKLPATPCDNCTLQVVQVMKDHGLSSCYYYHCANLKILPSAAGGSAGQSGTSTAAGATAAAGSGGVSAAAGGASGTASATAGAAGTAHASTAGVSGTATTPAGGAPGVAATAPHAGTGAAASAQTGSAGAPATTASSTASGAAGVKSTAAAATAAGSISPAASAAGSGSTAPASSSGGCSVTALGSHENPNALFMMTLVSVGLGVSQVRRRRERRATLS